MHALPDRGGAGRGNHRPDRGGRCGAVPLLVDLCETMKHGSLCALGGFTPYPVMSALTQFPEDFAGHREAAE
jgi:formate dehydrogenase iron-sulfur subunit